MAKNVKVILIDTALHLERWQSGRMHRFRKAAGAKVPREFESPPLRTKRTKCATAEMSKAPARFTREIRTPQPYRAEHGEMARRCPDRDFRVESLESRTFSPQKKEPVFAYRFLSNLNPLHLLHLPSNLVLVSTSHTSLQNISDYAVDCTLSQNF